MYSAPRPLFHGRPVLVAFDVRVRETALVLAGVSEVIERLEALDASEPELITAIISLIAGYDGLKPHLVDASESIEFWVTKP